MLDRKQLAIGVSSVFLASIILAVVAVLEYNFWWDYTSPIKNNRNLVEIVAAVTAQEDTPYNTIKTNYEYVFDQVLYTHETYLITEREVNITIYVDQTNPATVIFREPFDSRITVISAASLICVAGILALVVWPIYRGVFGEAKHASEIKW